MGSGAGKVILPLMSLAAAPLTGGASLGGLAGLGGLSGLGGGAGTALGIANAGIGALRAADRSRSDDAAAAVELQAAGTDRLLGALDNAERLTALEKRRARQLAGIANSGRVGGRAKAGLAGAADRDSQAALRSLDGRGVALDNRARNRIAVLRRRTRQAGRDRTFGLFEAIQDFGPAIDSFATFRD